MLLTSIKDNVLTPRRTTTGPVRAQLKLRSVDSQHLHSYKSKVCAVIYVPIDTHGHMGVGHWQCYSHQWVCGAISIREHRGRHAQNHKWCSIANQVQHWCGEAVPLDDLDLGESPDQQEELQGLQEHPGETGQNQEVEHAGHDLTSHLQRGPGSRYLTGHPLCSSSSLHPHVAYLPMTSYPRAYHPITFPYLT